MITHSRKYYSISVGGIAVAFLLTSRGFDLWRGIVLLLLGIAFLVVGIRVYRKRTEKTAPLPPITNEKKA